MLLDNLLVRLQPGIVRTILPFRALHASAPLSIDKRWRLKNRLPRFTNGFGPLTNKPDYTYKDGRPSPLGVRQLSRLFKNREFYEKIQTLAGEIDYAVARHKRIQQEEAAKKQAILDSKLKPKGRLLQ